MSIVSVVDKGRLHLGYAKENEAATKLGKSINFYGNFFTILASKLLKTSTKIEFDNKGVFVNKESFRKHISSLDLDVTSLKLINDMGYKSFILKNNANLIPSNERFGENFSNRTTNKLFSEFIFNLQANNSNKVKDLIRKGVDVNKEFFITDKAVITDRDWVLNSLEPQKVTRSTPLVLAVERGNQPLAQLILDQKSGNYSNDIKVTLKPGSWFSQLKGMKSIDTARISREKVVVDSEKNIFKLELVSEQRKVGSQKIQTTFFS